MNIYNLDSNDKLAFHIVLSDSDTDDNIILCGNLLKLVLSTATEYNKEGPSFYIRKQWIWERQVQELHQEGAFG
jgi:hypothetical protein